MSLLSIIIPVYNAEKTLQRTIRSLNHIKKNNHERVEVIFVNDGSTDKSREIIEAYINNNQGFIFQLINKPNGGTSSARNRGLDIAAGEWIFFLDADDELCFNPVYWINRFPCKTAIGFSNVYYKNFKRFFKLRPAKITKESFLDIFTASNPVTTSSITFKKEKISKIFDDKMIFLEDWLFWLTNPEIFKSMVIIPSVTSSKIHMHGNNKTSDQHKNGKYRIKVAKKIIEIYGEKLTKKQKNNISIQKKIGLIQQGRPVKQAFSLDFPCDFILYIKFIVYILFQRFSEKCGPYAKNHN